MQPADQLAAIQKYVYKLFDDDVSGHDFFHMKRVAHTAKQIAAQEQANLFICEAAAWIHDIGDDKLFTDRAKVINDVNRFLQSIDCTNTQINRINTAMKDVSFSKGNVPDTIDGKIVQDADRLDAIGAIGIARTFAYGAANDQKLWDDQKDEQQNTSIQHFYDKLLQLTDLMNTTSAKQMAAERHQFMERYLQQFFREWK
ncbi:HD domain-containing protein [Lentibacillus salinarum]|uniref:HD domain-containing protein n=1 Tax=Lentibacillus salinarum TaxID=446820 RepID=A0ABW3ZQ89_9BACI